MIFGPAPFMRIGGQRNFLQMIEAIAADSNLLFCLDAAAIGSYPGSGSSFLDLTANNNDWGINGPTFNGVAGALTADEYFSYDGTNDYFDNSGSYADGFHKDSAAWTVCGVDWFATSDVVETHFLFSTAVPNDNAANERIVISGRSLDEGGGGTVQTVVQGSVRQGNNGSALSIFSPLSGVAYELVFWAIALDETVGAGGVTLRINDDTQSLSSTFSSPSSDNPTGDYSIGRDVSFANGTITQYSAADMRTYCRAVWDRRLSTDEIDDLYDQVKARYTTLP